MEQFFRLKIITADSVSSMLAGLIAENWLKISFDFIFEVFFFTHAIYGQKDLWKDLNSIVGFERIPVVTWMCIIGFEGSTIIAIITELNHGWNHKQDYQRMWNMFLNYLC